MDDRIVTNSSRWQVDTDINYQLDTMAHELSGYTDLNEPEEDDMPLGIQYDAMHQAGHFENYNQLLYEDEEDDAKMEIDEHFGPDNESLLSQNKIPKSYASLSDELNEMMQQANLSYIMGDEEQALNILRKVIHERPDAHEAWLSLGMIYNRREETQKMLECNMLAAHLSPKNGHLWKMLGCTSQELNNIEQATYCFKKAVKFDSADIESLWELCMIYLEQKQDSLAIEGFNKLLLIDNTNPMVIKEVAKLYREKGEQEKALQLYENLEFLDQNIPLNLDKPLDDEFEMEEEEEIEVMGTKAIVKQRFGFEEIDMTMDLLVDLQDYEKAIFAMKRGVARLHGSDITDIDYESELQYEEDYDIPLELLVKLGICRFLLGDVSAAKMQFEKLFNIEVDQYALLIFHVAELYMNNGQHEEALRYLKHLSTGIDSDSPIIWSKIAQCYLELEEYEMAIEMYEQVLTYNPDDLDIQNAIIKIYEDMGQNDNAEKRQKRFTREYDKRHSVLTTYIQPVFQSRVDYQSLFKYQTSVKRVEPKKIPADHGNRDEENSFLVLKLRQLSHSLDIEGKRLEYIRTSKKLISQFENNPKHFVRKYTRDALLLRDYKSHFLANDDTVDPEHELKMDKTFEGIKYSEWYKLIIEHVRLLAVEGRDGEAFQVLKNAHNSEIYFPDYKKRQQLKLLSISIYNNNAERAAQYCRWYCHEGPYLADGVRLYCAVLSESTTAFANSATQKYLMRHIAKLTSAEEEAHAHLYTLFGHTHLISKNYQMSIQYYLKARSILPDDPVINLCLGVSFIHRAFHKAERRSDHLIKGFTFLTHYRRLKNDCESDYNIARAFHHIGLLHIATPFYERCLQTEYSLEAAYNLHLIYVECGSYQLAKQILKQYCTF
ncbi:transcription factor TFIIIC subunit tfc4 [Terramyces sp. JEL0728]|nr:transcription factor TFIIIC subunit tfc4 [Terramyces sp. JEL0728]